MAFPDRSSPLRVSVGPLGGWQDLYDLPGFRKQLPADTIKTGVPVKRYSMPSLEGTRPCGISECRTPHFHGHVIQIGEVHSNVGQCCASKYFGRSEWKAHLRLLKAQEDAHAAEEALTQARAMAHTKAQEADAVPPGYQQVAMWLAAFDELPLRLRGDLGERAHRNQAQIIQYREPSEADIKRAKFHDKPRPRAQEVPIGTLLGVRAVAPNMRADAIFRRLTRQKEQLRTMVRDVSVTPVQLIDAMNLLETSRKQLDLAMARAREFFSEKNQKEIDKLPQGHVFRTILREHLDRTYQGAA